MKNITQSELKRCLHCGLKTGELSEFQVRINQDSRALDLNTTFTLPEDHGWA